METAGPVNHVFVDFENVHDIDLAVISSRSVTFTLFLGAKQKQLKVEVVEKLLRHASSVQLIRLESSGKNALDFAIAYYIGRAVAGDPAGIFHVISKDKGFDPLIEHLRAKQTKAWRHDDFSTLGFLPGVKVRGAAENPVAGVKRAVRPVPEKALVAGDRLPELVAHLADYAANRPTSKTKLVRDVVNYFSKQQLTDAHAKGLINQLRQRGYIAIDVKGAVTYKLPPRDGGDGGAGELGGGANTVST